MGSSLIVIGAVDDTEWQQQPESDLKLTWLDRRRCYKCRNYFMERGFAYFGAYCSRSCSGRPDISFEPADWSRSHRWGQQSKTYIMGPSDPRIKILPHPGLKTLYFDAYCGFWHIGTTRTEGIKDA